MAILDMTISTLARLQDGPGSGGGDVVLTTSWCRPSRSSRGSISCLMGLQYGLGPSALSRAAP